MEPLTGTWKTVMTYKCIHGFRTGQVSPTDCRCLGDDVCRKETAGPAHQPRAARTSPPARPLHAHLVAVALTLMSQYLSQTWRHLSGKPQVLARLSYSLSHLQDAPGQSSTPTPSLTPNSLLHNRLSLRLWHPELR